MAPPTFIPLRVSPAKAAINSDRAIAEERTGSWLSCQERSASHRLARSKYTFFTTEVSRFFTTEVSRSPRLPSRLAADARLQPSTRNVRFGSEPDIRRSLGLSPLHPPKRTLAGRPRDVRFVPIGDLAASLDHLVGAGEQLAAVTPGDEA